MLYKRAVKETLCLVVSRFSNSQWLPRHLKNVQNETAKRFSVGNTKVNILALTVYSLE